jgi:dihydroorotate dehydrogenase (NAD+) catalytic subunit
MKRDLFISTPLMNAAGTLGFAPDPRGPLDLDRLGAFVTNPVSVTSRKPARGERYIPFPGGFLLHTGYPNPGLSSLIRKCAPRWERSPLPVVVHLLAQDPDGLAAMVERLEGVGAVMAVEVGLPPGSDPDLASQMAHAALGELPVILRLPFENSEELALAVVETGVSAISISPPRGTLVGVNERHISGRIYGAAIFPQALAAVQRLAGIGIPLIGSGGVYRSGDITAMLSAGAMAVQLDTVLWRGEIPPYHDLSPSDEAVG